MSRTPANAPSPFVAELERLLAKRRLSWRRLAELAGYHPSWLSKIRNGRLPSADVVKRCDEVLEAGGTLIALASTEGETGPAQLPAAPAGFVGRDRELRRMREVLSRETPLIVAIDGPPGAGKTTAALCLGHRVNGPEGKLYPDGQLYVDLHGYSRKRHPARPENVLEEFLVALGVPARDIPAGVEQRAALYRSLLASRRLLIVLDNAASSEQVLPLIPNAPGCGVVVTSRRRLNGLAIQFGVERIMIGSMTEAESIAVLRKAIGVARTEGESLSALAELCGHLPLALRIAAERVAAHPHRPVSELVDELAAEEQRLDGLATDDSVPVRTVFEWSYHDLSDAQARMFRLLGLHEGPNFSVEAAAALAGVPVVQARRLLEKLSGVHLLEAAPHGRYRFHDLMRLYAAERVEAEEDPEDRGASVRRLTDWYLHSSAAGGRALAPFRLNPLELRPPEPGCVPMTFADDKVALRWFDIEALNFMAVVSLAMEHELYDTVWQTAVALWDYLRLLRNPGRLWVDTTTTAQEAARAAGNSYAEGWVETSLADGYRWLGHYDRSQQLFEHALTIRQRIGDRHGQAWALAGSGFLAIDRGRLEHALRYAQEALLVFREIGDRHGEASALFTVADAYHGWQRYDEALQTLEDSFRIFDEIGNHDGQGLILVKMAEVHIARGEHQQALSHLDRSLQARRLAGSRWGEADGLARRGYTLQVLGRPQDARESWEAALALYDEVNDPRVTDIRAYLRGDAVDLRANVLSRPGW
ncbi:ATP-binding protein [Streptosporangium carneum]|nr:tetratricopeptide repeat protein [Streptosporangium carneum]